MEEGEFSEAREDGMPSRGPTDEDAWGSKKPRKYLAVNLFTDGSSFQDVEKPKPMAC